MQKLLWGVLLISISISCQKKEVPLKPTVGTLTLSVYVSVTAQPDSLYQVFSSVNGILERSLVSEGDVIKKDAPLFQIINTNTKLQAENAKLGYNLAQKNYSGSTAILRSIEDEINAAQLKLHNDSINFFRQKNLWEQRIGSKAQFDAKQLAFSLSRNAIASLKTKYNRTKNELQTQLSLSSNTYKNSIITRQDYTVTSKINARVYALYKNPGEIVSPQQPLAILGSKDRFVLELLVDEVDIVNISEGQKVVISLDAYPNKTFLAQVSKIFPNKDERNQTFKVEALFAEMPAKLYPGLTGEGNIIISVKENVLIIPREYLFEKNKVKTEEGIIEVSTGLQTDDQIEIRSGISAYTGLLKPDVNEY
jgi:multidrug efflux pump subunit AcrA (membrane-fusion protein)